LLKVTDAEQHYARLWKTAKRCAFEELIRATGEIRCMRECFQGTVERVVQAREVAIGLKTTVSNGQEDHIGPLVLDIALA
jgi:hypothetical protein